MDEDRSSTRPEHDQRSKSARFPLARPRNPLLDRSAAEIRRDQTPFRLGHRPAPHP